MNTEDITTYIGKGIEKLIHTIYKDSRIDTLEKRFLLRQVIIQQQKRLLRTKQNIHIPPFLIASITEQCNLHCTGCYARKCHTDSEISGREPLTAENWKRIFKEADNIGISFILLAGGEPLMNKEVIKAAAAEKNMIFPLFTNGTLIDETYRDLFFQSRNLFPIFSLEGNAFRTNQRRGADIFKTVMKNAESFKTKGIVFGISITVTADNLHEITTKSYLTSLATKGCAVVIFVEYTSITDNKEDTEKELNENERTYLSKTLTNLRKEIPSLWLISFPGDEKFMGGCLAAGRGFFHINSYGDAEPCPFSPYSDTNLKQSSLYNAIQSPLFYQMNTTGLLSQMHTGGCALVGKKEDIKKMILRTSQSE